MSLPDKVTIRQFDGKGFLSWKYVMESVLDQKGCKKVILEADISKVDKEVESKAKMILALSVAESRISIIRRKETAYLQWKVLCDKFEK